MVQNKPEHKQLSRGFGTSVFQKTTDWTSLYPGRAKKIKNKLCEHLILKTKLRNHCSVNTVREGSGYVEFNDAISIHQKRGTRKTTSVRFRVVKRFHKNANWLTTYCRRDATAAPWLHSVTWSFCFYLIKNQTFQNQINKTLYELQPDIA